MFFFLIYIVWFGTFISKKYRMNIWKVIKAIRINDTKDLLYFSYPDFVWWIQLIFICAFWCFYSSQPYIKWKRHAFDCLRKYKSTLHSLFFVFLFQIFWHIVVSLMPTLLLPLLNDSTIMKKRSDAFFIDILLIVMDIVFLPKNKIW